MSHLEIDRESLYHMVKKAEANQQRPASSKASSPNMKLHYMFKKSAPQSQKNSKSPQRNIDTNGKKISQASLKNLFSPLEKKLSTPSTSSGYNIKGNSLLSKSIKKPDHIHSSTDLRKHSQYDSSIKHEDIESLKYDMNFESGKKEKLMLSRDSSHQDFLDKNGNLNFSTNLLSNRHMSLNPNNFFAHDAKDPKHVFKFFNENRDGRSSKLENRIDTPTYQDLTKLLKDDKGALFNQAFNEAFQKSKGSQYIVKYNLYEDNSEDPFSKVSTKTPSQNSEIKKTLLSQKSITKQETNDTVGSDHKGENKSKKMMPHYYMLELEKSNILKEHSPVKGTPLNTSSTHTFAAKNMIPNKYHVERSNSGSKSPVEYMKSLYNQKRKEMSANKNKGSFLKNEIPKATVAASQNKSQNTSIRKNSSGHLTDRTATSKTPRQQTPNNKKLYQIVNMNAILQDKKFSVAPVSLSARDKYPQTTRNIVSSHSTRRISVEEIGSEIILNMPKTTKQKPSTGLNTPRDHKSDVEYKGERTNSVSSTKNLITPNNYASLKKQFQEQRKDRSFKSVDWDQSSTMREQLRAISSNELVQRQANSPVGAQVNKNSEDLNQILFRTKRVLEQYKKKEKIWENEKQLLLEEIKILKGKLEMVS